MIDTVVDIISRVAKKDAADLLARRSEKGLWDSFALVEMVLLLEDEFGISFRQEEISTMATVDAVLALVEQKV